MIWRLLQGSVCRKEELGAFFYGFAFLFLNFPYLSSENDRTPGFRVQGALEEEENCHGRSKLLPPTHSLPTTWLNKQQEKWVTVSSGEEGHNSLIFMQFAC